MYASFLTLLLISSAYADNTACNYKPWLDYARNIETCTPQEFTLPPPNFTFLTPDEKKSLHLSNSVQSYKIHGFENGKCIVSNKDRLAAGHVSISTQYCSFSKEDLSIISKFARSLGKTTKGEAKTFGQNYVELLKKNCEMVY